VALADGARTMLSETSTPDAVNPFGAPGAIAVDGDNSRALVIDFGSSAVLAVAHADGARTILSDATTPDAVKPFNSLIDIAVDSANGRALVTDAVGFNPGEGAVVAVDLMTGARTILSDAMTPDAVNPITAGPIAVDSANGRALVTNIISPPPSVPPDPSQGVVIAVDLMTGARTILSDSSAGMNGGDANPLVFPIAIAVDSANDRALVLDENLQAVVTVDLMTGARTILSDATTPDTVNPFTRVFNIVVDSANNRALVLDSNLPGVVAVDLASGARTIVSDASGPGAVNSFQMPVGIALDSVNERALVTDLAGFNAVIAVELTSGDRVIGSK
jgi:DNA-binding beta-propeller fold protein YncE